MSRPHFAIGEVAIYWRPESPNHNTEVTIAGRLQLICAADHVTGTVEECAAYPLDELSPHNGRTAWCKPAFLRKKQPPFDDRQVTRWADCPWQPEKLRV